MHERVAPSAEECVGLLGFAIVGKNSPDEICSTLVLIRDEMMPTEAEPTADGSIRYYH